MIKPTIGRVVWYWPVNRVQADQPHAAIIAHVWSDRMVNLAYFDSNGIAHNATSVPLVQEGDPPSGESAARSYCEWMPYQEAVAKGEPLEKAARQDER